MPRIYSYDYLDSFFVHIKPDCPIIRQLTVFSFVVIHNSWFVIAIIGWGCTKTRH